MLSRVNLLVLGGSRAFGTAFPDCDYDYYGVWTRPLRDVLGLKNGKDSYQKIVGEDDYTFHELGKFVRLALKGNPTALDTIFSPHTIYQDETGARLHAVRDGFLSKRVLGAYIGYAANQLDHFDKHTRLHSRGGKPGAKFLAHAIRLLCGGIHLAETGEYMMALPSHLVEEIRTLLELGQFAPDSVISLMRDLLVELKELRDTTTMLRNEPDQAFFDNFLYQTRVMSLL